MTVTAKLIMTRTTVLAQRLACLLLATAGFIASPVQSQSATSSTMPAGHVQGSLVANAPDGIAPGTTVLAGLQLKHEPGWHTYWKNPGDTGQATDLKWTLPPGITAGEISWPVPSRIQIGSLTNYGLENTALLTVPLRIAPEFQTQTIAAGDEEVEIRLSATWLACRKECVPESGDFTMRIPVRSSTGFNAQDSQALMHQPQDLHGTGNRVEVVGDSLQMTVQGLPSAVQGMTLDLYPETPSLTVAGAAPGAGMEQHWEGGVWRATVPLIGHRQANPGALAMVVALPTENREPGSVWGWRVVADITGAWPGRSQADPQAAPAAAPIGTGAFLVALLAAVAGGILLNLMPCVFPVLAIKVLGFAKNATNVHARRQAGMAYTLGVVLSFLLLGMLMLALRSAGAQLGWGFQLQSPTMIVALAMLFTLIGLNLIGMYEIGSFVPSCIAATQMRTPLANDFLSGVLAVAVASPCTAPLMGASLGLAMLMPPLQALALFGALGVGMALPYLVATLVPGIARLVPRPGPWMVTLRKTLAFPMFGTVAWLVWVLGKQIGINGAGALLVLLVALGAIVWAMSLRGRTRLLVGSIVISANGVLVASVAPALAAAPGSTAATTAEDKRWGVWSASRTASYLSAGQSVFVDFTAAWCVTCQVNKKTTLSNGAVLAEFESRNIALLRADWTRRDPAITAALAELGRNGVPVYALYRPGRAPMILTEILTPAQVHNALANP